ncbi:GNAT family N-acetyltransferase, partial [Staphylococcus aureus]|nr:GNAT family N-acetyltransferase [Staphylococcus aureus]
VKYDMARDKGENPLIWHPDMDREMTPGESA